MKNYSLKPTDENVLELLENDSIGRKESVFQFVRLLTHMKGDCYTVALNGDWGSGKTFFIKQVKMILDTFNPNFNMEEEMREKVKNSYLNHGGEKLDLYATVYYDAWACDNHEDPILSLVYAAVQSRPELDLEKEPRIIEAATLVIDAVTGKNLTSLIDGFKKMQPENFLAAIKESEALKGRIREFINSLVAERGNRLVIFIDELDRCKPDYAVRFLERIKHYFDDERITFVFAINSTQLMWTVRNYYGNGFDATKYLDKFFDIPIAMPTADYDRFIRERLHFDVDTIGDIVYYEVIRQFDFSLRQIERYVRLMKIVESRFGSWGGSGTTEYHAKMFAANCIAPIVIGLQMYDLEKYRDFVSGNDPETMVKILMEVRELRYNSTILGQNETFMEDSSSIVINKGAGGERIRLEDRLRDIYYAIYGKQKNTEGEKESEKVIGQLRFSNRIKTYIENITSMLFPDANYAFK
jgi:KAP P-loop domain-containing protein